MTRRLPLLVFLVAVFFFETNVAAFKVCGNFCGANWCNGGHKSEWIADTDHCGPTYLQPQVDKKTGQSSCADACCLKHDQCCSVGGNDPPSSILKTSGCNKMIVDCLSQCNHFDHSCTNGILPVPAGVVWAAMNLVQGWCCGEKCPKQTSLRGEAPELPFLEDIMEDEPAGQNGDPFLVSTSFLGDSCDKPQASKLAERCNTCSVVNNTASSMVSCSKGGSCSQGLYDNVECGGDPISTQDVPCGGSCTPINASGGAYSSVATVVTDIAGALKDFHYPIVQQFQSNDCSGSPSGYLEFGGCKDIGGGESMERVCRDGSTYLCTYSGSKCETETTCQGPLPASVPGVCQNMSRGLVTSSQKWVCS